MFLELNIDLGPCGGGNGSSQVPSPLGRSCSRNADRDTVLNYGYLKGLTLW